MLKIHRDADGHEHHVMGTGDSSCFYDPPVDITDWVREKLALGHRIEVRTARIEVSDQDGKLHAHEGYTLGAAFSGCGDIRNEEDPLPLASGDRFSFGPGDPHLSVAKPGRTLIELVVYIGVAGDRQDLVELD